MHAQITSSLLCTHLLSFNYKHILDMHAQITTPLEDDILFWIVNFNADFKIIELHPSHSLAAFK